MVDQTWRALDVDGRAVVDLEQLGVMFRVARAVQVAWKLGIWQRLLVDAATARQVADDCETQAEPTERLLTLLAATGLVYRQPDGRFRLTDQGVATFDPASPRYYGDGLSHLAGIADRWQALEDTLRTPPAEGTGAPHMPPHVHRTFVMAMQDYAIRGRCQWLAGNVDLSGRRHLLDLGGGPGTYSVALCEAYPELRATIFDLPGTGPLAAENVARFGLSERVGFVGGNFDTDDLGTGYDCALASNVLHGAHHGSEARLRRLRATLPAGGLLIVQDFVIDDDGNGPLEAAMFGLHVGAYRVSEMIGVIEAAGFERVTLRGRGPAGNGLFTGLVPA
ncbi:MAG: hypothetical protein HZB16_10070 [Armatimonadetes bacterium]|nr:hypothetical protein [Armatimonadota bacterium]